MHPLKRAALYLSVYCGIVGLSAAALAATEAAVHGAGSQDPQHAFDWEFGTWKTHVRRRLHPLSGTEAWAEYDGTSVVSRIWGGKANLVELEVDGPAGHLELASWRLYDPETRQWSLNVASSRGGGLGVPTVGGFKDGKAEFYDDETFDGKPVRVRFVISDVKPGSAHFEQAFSPDGGKTWELNWIADDVRETAPAAPAPTPSL
jgi:hypothetical protein